LFLAKDDANSFQKKFQWPTKRYKQKICKEDSRLAAQRSHLKTIAQPLEHIFPSVGNLLWMSLYTRIDFEGRISLCQIILVQGSKGYEAFETYKSFKVKRTSHTMSPNKLCKKI
jgi:hypothetical protein